MEDELYCVGLSNSVIYKVKIIEWLEISSFPPPLCSINTLVPCNTRVQSGTFKVSDISELLRFPYARQNCFSCNVDLG